MTTTAIYCSKCLKANGNHIAIGKVSPDVFRRVIVVGQSNSGSYQCKCECGHTWLSKSQEAALLYHQATAEQHNNRRVLGADAAANSNKE